MRLDLFGVVSAIALVDLFVESEGSGVELGLRCRQQVEMVAGVLPAHRHREQPVRADRAHMGRDVS